MFCLPPFLFASADPSIPDVFRHQPGLAGSRGDQAIVLSGNDQGSEKSPSPINQKGIDNATEI